MISAFAYLSFALFLSILSYIFTMPLELHPLTASDALSAAHLVVESFKNNPFRRIVFPNGMGQASIDKLASSHSSAVSDPTKHGMKVIDTDNDGIIVACATWQETKAMTEEDWEREKEEEMKGYPDARMDLAGEFIIKSLDAKKRIKGHERRWWELLSLNVLPSYQRRGIGSMLMDWGNAKQEELGLPGFIVASDQGYGLYLKHGYQETERWEFDMAEWAHLGGSGWYRNVYLVRGMWGEERV